MPNFNNMGMKALLIIVIVILTIAFIVIVKLIGDSLNTDEPDTRPDSDTALTKQSSFEGAQITFAASFFLLKIKNNL